MYILHAHRHDNTLFVGKKKTELPQATPTQVKILYIVDSSQLHTRASTVQIILFMVKVQIYTTTGHTNILQKFVCMCLQYYAPLCWWGSTGSSLPCASKQGGWNSPSTTGTWTVHISWILWIKYDCKLLTTNSLLCVYILPNGFSWRQPGGCGNLLHLRKKISFGEKWWHRPVKIPLALPRTIPWMTFLAHRLEGWWSWSQTAWKSHREFEERHVEVLNFIAAEDTTALESEEAVFDEHVDRVTEFIEQLEQLEDLVGTTEKGETLYRQLAKWLSQEPADPPTTTHSKLLQNLFDLIARAYYISFASLHWSC